MTQYRSRVLGIGGFVPPRIVTNDDLAKLMETSHEWIVERTGIEQRHWVDEGMGGAEMGANAAKEALEMAGVNPSEIDLIIYATLSPDHVFPGTAVFVQRLLELKNIPCLDIRQQCTGFIYGLAVADNFIRMGQYKNVLLIGSEVHSTGLDVTTGGRDVACLFGDGAGAWLLGRSESEDQMVLSTHLHADGKNAEILWVEKPGCRYHPRITADDLEQGLHYPKMQGRKVFKHAVTKMPTVMAEGMHANGLTLDDVDMLIPHQANLRINEMVGKMIGLPPEKMHNNIQKLGNTTAASIPLCFKDAMQLGKIKRGDLVCLVAFGAGLTWGSAFLRF